jgi:hypothetical protein
MYICCVPSLTSFITRCEPHSTIAASKPRPRTPAESTHKALLQKKLVSGAIPCRKTIVPRTIAVGMNIQNACSAPRNCHFRCTGCVRI